MTIELKFKDTQPFTDPNARLIELNAFLSDCENEVLTDESGFSCEIVQGNRVLSDDLHDIADFLDDYNRTTLLAAQGSRGTIYIAWYNADAKMEVNQ